jgi:hypothetical protein
VKRETEKVPYSKIGGRLRQLLIAALMCVWAANAVASPEWNAQSSYESTANRWSGALMCNMSSTYLVMWEARTHGLLCQFGRSDMGIAELFVQAIPNLEFICLEHIESLLKIHNVQIVDQAQSASFYLGVACSESELRSWLPREAPRSLFMYALGRETTFPPTSPPWINVPIDVLLQRSAAAIVPPVVFRWMVKTAKAEGWTAASANYAAIPYLRGGVVTAGYEVRLDFTSEGRRFDKQEELPWSPNEKV